MADDIELPAYPVHDGHIVAQQLVSGRVRLLSQMDAIDDEMRSISDTFERAFEKADRQTTTQERIAALAKSKRPNR